MEKSIKSLKEIAERLLFSKITNDDFYGWTYRKGKSSSDINKAIHKAVNPKNGFGKIEFEIRMLEVYLKDILKLSKGITCDLKLTKTQILLLERLYNSVGSSYHFSPSDFNSKTVESLLNKNLIVINPGYNILNLTDKGKFYIIEHLKTK